MEPEPTLHAHLFVPLLHDGGVMSIDGMSAAVSALPKKSNLVIQWVKAAREAGLIERAAELEKCDPLDREIGPRLYRLTEAGDEQVEDYVAPTRRDREFLVRLEHLGPGQTAESLSTVNNQPGTEYLILWIESAYARGLIGRTERGEPVKVGLTEAGVQRLEEF